MIFPLLEAVEGMLYRTAWTDRGYLYMRGTVKSTLAVDVFSTNKTEQSSQVGTLANPCQLWQTLTRFAVYFKQKRFWRMYLGFMEAFYVMSSSQKQNHGLQKQSVR